MLDDIQHLLIGTDSKCVDIGGVPCRPLTFQTYCLLEITGNELLFGGGKMADILTFIYLHSAPQEEIKKVVSAYMAGDKSVLLWKAMEIKTMQLSDVDAIAKAIKKQIDDAFPQSANSDASESVSGNEVGQA